MQIKLNLRKYRDQLVSEGKITQAESETISSIAHQRAIVVLVLGYILGIAVMLP